MTTGKTVRKKVPIIHFQKIEHIADSFKIPQTKAFIIRDKLLFGEYTTKKIKKKGRGKKEIYEIEFF